MENAADGLHVPFHEPNRGPEQYGGAFLVLNIRDASIFRILCCRTKAWLVEKVVCQTDGFFSEGLW